MDILIVGIFSAILGGYFTYFTTRMKINAELRASTRLKWITEVRQLIAKIIDYHSRYIILIATTQNQLFDNPRTVLVHEYIMTNFSRESREIISIIKKDINLYKLYFAKKSHITSTSFTNNPENEAMHEIIDNIFESLINLDARFTEDPEMNDLQKLINEEFERINNFREVNSDYLQKEWETAIRNK